MISKEVESLEEILRISRNAVKTYCTKKHIPVIPVWIVRKEQMITKEFAYFDPINQCICISDNSRVFIIKHIPKNRVWWMNNYIVHELTHYVQFINKIRNKRPMHFTKEDEEQAVNTSTQYADLVLSTYTVEEINPIKSRKSNPESLYESFHDSPPANMRKILYENPDPKKPLVKIGRVTMINYLPEYPSKKSGVEYTHKSGDTGEQILKSNLILATDESGKNLYLIKDKKSKYPLVNSRGIIGVFFGFMIINIFILNFLSMGVRWTGAN